LRTGYVVWRRRKLVGYILTIVKNLEDLSEAASSQRQTLKVSEGEIEIPEFLRKQAD
jgi:hypothetical protein